MLDDIHSDGGLSRNGQKRRRQAEDKQNTGKAGGTHTATLPPFGGIATALYRLWQYQGIGSLNHWAIAELSNCVIG